MTALKAFVVFFLMQPLGHAYMIVAEKLGPEWEVGAAIVAALIGIVPIIWSRFVKNATTQTVLGMFSGFFLWTAFVEYGFKFGAHQLGIPPSPNGTAGEYRMLEHTWGLVLMLIIYLMFHKGVRCDAMVWLRKTLKLVDGNLVEGRVGNYAPRVAFETFSATWTYYVILLLLYDESIFGVHSLVTRIAFVLFLGGGAYLLYKNFQFREFGAALRYAIPTVITFWSGIEILAKWGVFREPWITLNPAVMIPIAIAFAFAIYLVVRDLKIRRRGVSG